MPIYTRTGDDGTTVLFGGKRVLKCEELVDVYGSIDELNSWMGLVISSIDESYKNKLQIIQKDLFLTGCFIAGWQADISKLEKKIIDMEEWIDEMEKCLPMLNNFILPGGAVTGSYLHVARSIARRVERQYIKLVHGSSAINHELITKYLNRLSDLLFVLARYINRNVNIPEIIWSGKELTNQDQK